VPTRLIGFILKLTAWVAVAAFGLLALGIVMGLAGYPSPFPDTEITQEKPYADFVGREYRVLSGVSSVRLERLSG
jgi:hypothetical protein